MFKTHNISQWHYKTCPRTWPNYPNQDVRPMTTDRHVFHVSIATSLAPWFGSLNSLQNYPLRLITGRCWSLGNAKGLENHKNVSKMAGGDIVKILFLLLVSRSFQWNHESLAFHRTRTGHLSSSDLLNHGVHCLCNWMFTRLSNIPCTCTRNEKKQAVSLRETRGPFYTCQLCVFSMCFSMPSRTIQLPKLLIGNSGLVQWVASYPRLIVPTVSLWNVVELHKKRKTWHVPTKR